jgi:hypothetical protein
MIKRGILVVTVLLQSLGLHAEFAFSSNCRQAYDHIISLRFGEGRRYIEAEKRSNPANAIPYLLDNYIDYLGTFISEREDLFEKWKDARDERLDKIKAGNSQSPYYLFAQAQIYIQLGFVRFKFKEYATGAYEVHKAYKLLEKNNELFPSFRANLMGLGLLHALIGTVPEDYKWVASLVGMQGTVQQGISELNLVVSSSRGSSYEYLYPEASLLLALLQIYLQKDMVSAEKVLKDLELQTPVFNPVVCFMETSLYLHSGRNDDALRTLRNRPRDPVYFPILYLDYLEGIARLNKLDPDAPQFFLRYVNEFKGRSFIKAAYQKLAWYYLCSGNTARYTEYMAHCRVQGEADIDEDKQALNEATTREIPNVILLKSRLYFDGGYYGKALAEIAGKSADKFPKVRDKVELTYRLARIYHRMGENTKAIEYYQLTLKNGEKLRYHFAANSALELGYIFEQRHDKPRARQYFSKCLSMRGHEYQNGIDQKAKAGLSRLGS